MVPLQLNGMQHLFMLACLCLTSQCVSSENGLYITFRLCVVSVSWESSAEVDIQLPQIDWNLNSLLFVMNMDF